MKKHISKILLGIFLFQFLILPSGFAQTNNIKDTGRYFTETKNIKDTDRNIENNLEQYKNESSTSILENKIEQNIAVKPNFQLSTTEKLFNNDQNLNSENIIKQFGYELFGNGANAPLNSKISKDYKLRIGDRVNVYFWGDTIDLLSIAGSSIIQPSTDITVDRDGNIFISGVGLIQAKDKPVADMEQQIRSSLSKKFTGFKVKVTVYEPGNFPVMVMGNVKNPGVVYLSASSTFLDAINLAGGITKDGSLREITYINGTNKNKIIIDIYDLLIKGNQKQITLKDNDVILVKPIGKVMALSNGVKRPAVYEFKNNESLQDIINAAGGLLPSADSKSIQIEGFDKLSNQKILRDVNITEISKFFPNDGDLISFKSAYNVSENIITLEGNIKHPGNFQYKEGMKLSDVLKSKDELLTKTFMYQAVIERISGINREVLTIPVSLIDFFNGYINPKLEAQDKIKIFSDTKMSNIEISGYVNNPGLTPFKEGMTLKDVIANIDFETTSDASYANSKIVGKMKKVNINNLVAEITSTNETNVKTIYLYELLTKNDNESNIEIQDGDKILFRPVTDKETLRTVKVLGYVKSPGIYKVQPGMKISDAIETAGGLTEEAYLKGLVFVRPAISIQQKLVQEDTLLRLQEDLALKISNMQAIDKNNKKTDTEEFANAQKELINIQEKKLNETQGRIAISIKDNKISENDDLEIKDGDEIFIPSTPQHIMTIGEVHNQSAIAYSPYKNAKYYINNVGGFTKQANKSEMYIIKANGTSIRAKNITSLTIDPGDTIVIPRKVTPPISWSSILKDSLQVFISSLSTIYMITRF